jgi:polyferredoxin
MDKMGYERKLISYTTENQLEGKKTHILRSKLIGYGSVLLIMSVVFIYFLMAMQPTKLDIIRDRNQLYRISTEGMLENVYTLKLLNKTEQDLIYKLSFSGLKDFTWQGRSTVTVSAGEVFTLPMSISVDPYNLKKKVTSVTFSARATLNDGKQVSVTEESRFFNEI